MKNSYNLLKDAFSIKNTVSCMFDSLHGFASDFSQNGNVDGWDLYSNICLYGVWDAVLFGTSLDRECYIGRSNPFFPIPAESYHIVKITMKMTIPDSIDSSAYPTKGKVMWQTASDPSWDDNKSREFDLDLSDQWYTYVINMGESQYWQGDIQTLRIFPFIDGKADIRFTIKGIYIDAVSDFKCINTQCSYYNKYRHPCPGVGTLSAITSGLGKEEYNIVSGETDKLIINIDNYGDEQLNLGEHGRVSGADLAKILVNKISLVSYGQYAYMHADYEKSSGKLTIYSGTPMNGGNIQVRGPAALEMGFINEQGEDISEHTEGKDPETGFDYAASRRLKGFEINALLDADVKSTAYFHNPNQYTVEAGRRDFMDSMSATFHPRAQDVDYYKEIDGSNKIIIDGSHPISDSGRLKVIKVNGTKVTDDYRNYSTTPIKQSQLSKVLLLRPRRGNKVELINEAFIPEEDKDLLYTKNAITYSTDVDWLVNKGDLIGFYNFNPLVPYSNKVHEPNAVYFEVAGFPEEKVFSMGPPAAKGLIGISFYGRSDRLQEDLKLEIDLGKRMNIEEVSVYGLELKTTYEYNVAACLDVNWDVDLYNETHFHVIGWCWPPGPGYVVEHRNIAYGIEALSDCIRTPDNGQVGDSFAISSMGGPVDYTGGSAYLRSDPDTYNGIATIGKHSYFYVNGDGEWAFGGCNGWEGRPIITDPSAFMFKHEFKSPWRHVKLYGFEFDPITFTLLFPAGRKLDIHKTGIYFKESDNFKHFSMSYYLGPSGEQGDAEEINWKYVPSFNSVTIDGTLMLEGQASGDTANEKYDLIYFKNPWPWAKPEYKNGKCINSDIYQTIMNERMNVMEHEFDPVSAQGFRFHTAWHRSTKINEMEVYSSLNIEPSLLDNINMYSSVYGDDWYSIVFTADEDNDEHIKSYVSGAPQFFRLELQSQDLFKLMEVSGKVSDEHIKALDCETTLPIEEAPRGRVTDTQELVLENTYNIPLDVEIGIPRRLFKQDNILSWVKFDSEDTTINAEIGPGAIVRKNNDYPIYLESGQIAINAPTYYLRNLIDGKSLYEYKNEHKWNYLKTAYANEDLDYTNNIYSKKHTLSFDPVSGKYWKLLNYSNNLYNLENISIWSEGKLVTPPYVYIQAASGDSSQKILTTIDESTGTFAPVTVLQDDFSDGMYSNYWSYTLSGTNDFRETDVGLTPFLDSYGKASLYKDLEVPVLSFESELVFNTYSHDAFLYKLEFRDVTNRTVFALELTQNKNLLFDVLIHSPVPQEQIDYATAKGAAIPMRYYESTTSLYRTDTSDLILSMKKEFNSFTKLSLKSQDGEIFYEMDTDSLLAFPDRISRIVLSYENNSVSTIRTITSRLATKSLTFTALPVFSSREGIAFSFYGSEPIDTIKLIHEGDTSDKLGIFVSNLDNNDYMVWAKGFYLSGNLANTSEANFGNDFYNYHWYTGTSRAWFAFVEGQWNSNHANEVNKDDYWLRYDFGAGNGRAINHIQIPSDAEYAAPCTLKIYGSNTYTESFNKTNSANQLLITHEIAIGFENTMRLNNTVKYRFYILFFEPSTAEVLDAVKFKKAIMFRELFPAIDVNSLLPNKNILFRLEQDGEEGSNEFVDSSGFGIVIQNSDLGVSHTTTDYKVGTSSVKFLGDSQPVMRVLAHQNFEFNGESFMADLWVRFDRVDLSQLIVSTENIYSDKSIGWELGFSPTDRKITWHVGNDEVLYSNKVIAADTWYHIALVYIQETCYLYIDKEFDNSIQYKLKMSGNYGMYVGRSAFTGYSNTKYWLYGNIDDFCISRIYYTPERELSITSDLFTDYLVIDLGKTHYLDFLRNYGPADNLLPIYNTSLVAYSDTDTSDISQVNWESTAPTLLLNFEDYIDSSDNNFTVTKIGSTTLHTTNSHVEPNGHLELAGGYLQIAKAPKLDLIYNEFTMDFLCKRSRTGQEGVLGQASDFTNFSTYSFIFNASDHVEFSFFVSGTAYILKSNDPITDNDWHHYAIIRQEDTIVLYVDGSPNDSITLSHNTSLNVADCPITIGKVNNDDFIGYLDEFRLIVHAAYWTRAFVPPTIAYSMDLVGNPTSARWIRIPFISGLGSEQRLQYVGIYPEIGVPYMPQGHLNCEWLPLHVKLSDYNTSELNLSMQAGVFYDHQVIYDFNGHNLSDWEGVSYTLNLPERVYSTRFVGEHPDSIWDNTSINFSSEYSYITQERGELVLRLSKYEAGEAVLELPTTYLKDFSFEVSFLCDVLEFMDSGYLGIQIQVTLENDGQTYIMDRNVTHGSGSYINTYREPGTSTGVYSPGGTFNLIDKLRIKKIANELEFQYGYNDTFTSETLWTGFRNFLVNTESTNVTCRIRVYTGNKYPETLVKFTSVKLVNESDVKEVTGDWSITEADIYGKYLYLNTDSDYALAGPTCGPSKTMDGKKINDLSFSFNVYDENSGGGLALLDSNGDEILSIASFYYSHVLYYLEGAKEVNTNIPATTSDWYNVKITFDWTIYEATVTWTQQNGDYTASHVVALKKQTNFEKFKIITTYGKHREPTIKGIRFDNIQINTEQIWVEDFYPGNCLTGSSSVGFDNSWGFPEITDSLSLIINLGEIYRINRFRLTHSPDGNNSWYLKDYNIYGATSISGTFFPIIEVTDNDRTTTGHELAVPIEASYIKLEIIDYSKPSTPQTVNVYDNEGNYVTKTLTGGFLRSFDIIQSSSSYWLNSEEHPIVCMDLREQFEVSSHALEGPIYYPEYPENAEWSEDNSFFRTSDDITDDPNKVAFSPPTNTYTPFFYADQLFDEMQSGGPYALTTNVFIPKGHYKVLWETYDALEYSYVEISIHGPDTVKILSKERGEGWYPQSDEIDILENGYYAVYVSATGEASAQWGVRNVYFSRVEEFSKWVTVRRTNATNFTTDDTIDSLTPEGKDFLDLFKVFTSKATRPTEHWWFWTKNISTLENDGVNVKEGRKSLKINYPATNEEEVLRFLEGDCFGLDKNFSLKDSLSFWLYIEDIEKLDTEFGGFAFGSFDGYYDSLYENSELYNPDAKSNNVLANRAYFGWDLKDIELKTGWNYIRCRFDKFTDTYPEPSPNTGVLSRDLNFRNHVSSSFGMVFRGTGSSFYLLLDGLKIERNYFYDDVIYNNKGICLTWNEFTEVPISGASLARGTVEVWVKTYSDTEGTDLFEDVRSKTLFTLTNNNGDSISMSIRAGDWFEIGVGNTKAQYDSFYIDSKESDVSGFTFGIDEVFHMALVWDSTGSDIGNGDTLRLYINGIACMATTTKWEVNDNKGSILRLGGGNTYLANNDDCDGSAIFSNLKVYNYCKTNFDLVVQEPKESNEKAPNDFIYISSNNETFYNSESTELPLLYEQIEPGGKVSVYIKVDKTNMDLLHSVTGDITVDWKIPI